MRNLIRVLEDRRVLYVAFHLEVPQQVDDSLMRIREELTAALQQLPDNSPAVEPMKLMRAAARKFLSRDFPEFIHMGHHHDYGLRWRHGRGPTAPGVAALSGSERADRTSRGSMPSIARPRHRQCSIAQTLAGSFR